jgi:colanic acid biosynthesis glycosyl transferase WcaI
VGWAYRREQWQGVEVWRCPLWVPFRPSGLKRLLHLASFALSSLPIMVRQAFWRPQVVWMAEPSLFCAPAAWAAARLSGGRAWLHIQDFEVDAAFDLGLLKSPRLKRWVVGGERRLMRRFDVVSTISQRMLERAASKGVASSRLNFFPNWVHVAAFTNPSPEGAAAYRSDLRIPPHAPVALYSGNMGKKQGIEMLAEVARHCPDVQFVFCGSGVGREDLVARCEGLPNVRFLDLQPFERLADLLSMADVHLLPQRADAADLVMPSKLTGMLASGRPVVATAHEGTAIAIVVAECGLVVPPEDPGAFAAAVRTLASDESLRAQLGARGLAHAKAHMDKEALLSRFEKDMTGLVAKPPAFQP